MTSNIDNLAKPRRFFSFRGDIFRAIVLICTFQHLVVVTSEVGISNVFDKIRERISGESHEVYQWTNGPRQLLYRLSVDEWA